MLEQNEYKALPDLSEDERFAAMLQDSAQRAAWFARVPWPYKEKELGYVYFARKIGTNQFKIGWTRNVKARLQTLQSSSLELVEIHYIPILVTREAERDIQEMWYFNRVRGEWFDLNHWGGPA